jgi:hypothetical protein
MESGTGHRPVPLQLREVYAKDAAQTTQTAILPIEEHVIRRLNQWLQRTI